MIKGSVAFAALVGSSDTVIRKIQEQHALIDHDVLCTQHGFGRLAPELVKGQPATPSADVYACGILLHELVTGTVPFSADTTIATLMARVNAALDPDPALDRRSLGTFAVLSLVERARALGLPHVYLGYWIRECRKMNYKQAFRPLEMLDGRHWRRTLPA